MYPVFFQESLQPESGSCHYQKYNPFEALLQASVLRQLWNIAKWRTFIIIIIFLYLSLDRSCRLRLIYTGN